MITDILQLTGAASFGILAGALLTEGALFIPFWKMIPPKDFHQLHKDAGPKLFRFFAPITIVGPTVLSLAAISAVFSGDAKAIWSAIAAGLAAVVVSVYFLFFKAANEKIALPGKSSEALLAELQSWERWHWFRTIVALVAFVIALMAL